MSKSATMKKMTKGIESDMRRGSSCGQWHVPDHIRRVAAILNKNNSDHSPDVRAHNRHQLIAPCRLTFDSQGIGALHSQDAFLHNVSCGGLGLLTTEPRTRDDLIEIKFTIDRKVTFVCGAVVFCRHIEGNVHEVGVQLHQRGEEPMLATLVAGGDKDGPEWFIAARNKLREVRGEKKRSA